MLFNEYCLNPKGKSNTKKTIAFPTLSNDFSTIANFSVNVSKKCCSIYNSTLVNSSLLAKHFKSILGFNISFHSQLNKISNMFVLTQLLIRKPSKHLSFSSQSNL